MGVDDGDEVGMSDGVTDVLEVDMGDTEGVLVVTEGMMGGVNVMGCVNVGGCVRVAVGG